ncbi:hypothetical protein K1719_021700 [Acacia pycnantha]|nr:hypothetical protein K1719_021700 [Acacia pycnantha]
MTIKVRLCLAAQHQQVCALNEADRLVKVDQLSRDEAQKMFRDTVGPFIDQHFRDCSAYSKVYSDYLVECLVAQNFLSDINGTRKYQNALDRGYAILEHLTNVSLLEKEKQIIYVSMNDYMKQLASHISSKYL